MRTAKCKKSGSEPKEAEYRANPNEIAALERQFRRIDSDAWAPRVKVGATEEGKPTPLNPDHPHFAVGHVLLREALGTADPDFCDGILHQLHNIGTIGQQPVEEGLNFACSVIKSIKPEDQLETMLAAQMAVTHMAFMALSAFYPQVDGIHHINTVIGMINKLSRTYGMQMEGFKRYRTGGKQTVTVQHVSVGEGAQAILGNVTQNNEAPSKASANPTLALTHSRDAAMEMIDVRERTPISVRGKGRNGNQPFP